MIEVRPEILHYSGHGLEDRLLFSRPDSFLADDIALS